MDNKTFSEQTKNQSCNKKSKILVAVSLFLCLTAIVVIGGAVTVAVYPFAKGASSAPPHEMNLESKENLHSMIMKSHIAKRQGNRHINEVRASCYSNVSNDSLPVAKISARGRPNWGTTAPPSLEVPGYQASWSCSFSHGKSFVKGGMNFSQEDQSLYFPTCGHYYISSQVLFQYSAQDNQPNQNFSAYHGIEVHPNCGPYDDFYYRYSHSSQIERQHVRTSTYLSDLAQICEGGFIKVILPTNRNTCCARGDASTTYFSAFLVQEIDCPPQ